MDKIDDLIEACKSGDLKGVKYLVSLGCDPKADYNYAIQWASKNGHLEVVKYLMSLGCDHENVKQSIKYDVLQDCKVKLLTVLNSKIRNRYLQMEILKKMISSFTEFEIMSML